MLCSLQFSGVQLSFRSLFPTTRVAQSFYIASKKHDMKELISVSAEIASRFAYDAAIPISEKCIFHSSIRQYSIY